MNSSQRIAVAIVFLFTATTFLGFYQNCAKSSSGGGGGGSNSAASTGTSQYSNTSLIQTVTSPTVSAGATATITVTLASPPTTTVTFAYQTVNGNNSSSNSNAIAGTNYTTATGVLTFSAGQTSGTITVTTTTPAPTYNSSFQVQVGQLDLSPPVFDTATVTITGTQGAATTSSGSSSSLVTTGSNFTCAIKSGNVYCLGDNSYGELGQNNYAANSYSSAPVQVTFFTNATSISAGYNHVCAVQNSTAYCWGRNNANQVAPGSTSLYTNPTQVAGLTGVTQIAAGTDFTCALANGGVFCWGNNSTYQIGNPSYTPASNPTVGPPTQVSGLPSNVSMISAGGSHACAVANSAVYCWGSNLSYQIGNGTQTTATSATTPSTSGNNVSLAGGVTSVAAGNNFTCAVQSSNVYCWGTNDYGQTYYSQVGTAQSIPFSTGITSATSVGANNKSVCAVQSSGSLFCWGDNTSGQAGTTSTHAYVVQASNPLYAFSSGVTGVSSGFGHHSCAIVNSVFTCWGNNTAGEIGTNACKGITGTATYYECNLSL